MFVGKNIMLRPIKKDDLVVLNKIRNEQEVLDNLSIYLPYPQALETQEHRFNERIKDKYTNTPSFVISEHNGIPIGQCGTMETNWKNSYTKVWIFLGGKENRNKGFGSEAMKLLITFIFQEMNLNRVMLYVFSFNKRAVKSYEKMGFKLEGTLRQEIFRKGKYHDVYQMSILKSEFDKMFGGDEDVF